jgi:hypothetical protein
MKMADKTAPILCIHASDTHANEIPSSTQAGPSRTAAALHRPSGSQDLMQAEVDEKPWKYIGYKGYSEFLASENDFFILRRFSSVSIRIALWLQDQVTVLEEKLEDLDKKYSRKDAVDTNNGSFREDEDDRAAVLSQLREKLVQYSELFEI